MATITYKDKQYSIVKFAEEFCLGKSTVGTKFYSGESPENILKGRRYRNLAVKCKNKDYESIDYFCKSIGVEYDDFVKELQNGVSVNEFYDTHVNSNKQSSNGIELTNNDIIITNNDTISNKIKQPVMINSENELINKINSLNNITNINLIDFENVVSDNNILKQFTNNENNNLNIFFFNACIYSNNFYKIMMNSTALNFYILTYETESQLVDHLMLYYLGILSQIKPNITFNIVTKDSHFYKLQKYINNLNISNIGMNFLEDKDLRYVCSLSEYILKNKYIKDGSCIVRSEFPIIFKNFFKMRNKVPNEKYIENLINTLIEYEFVEYNAETDTYSEYYKFNLKKVSQVNSELKNTRAA